MRAHTPQGSAEHGLSFPSSSPLASSISVLKCCLFRKTTAVVTPCGGRDRDGQWEPQHPCEHSSQSVLEQRRHRQASIPCPHFTIHRNTCLVLLVTPARPGTELSVDQGHPYIVCSSGVSSTTRPLLYANLHGGSLLSFLFVFLNLLGCFLNRSLAVVCSPRCFIVIGHSLPLSSRFW